MSMQDLKPVRLAIAAALREHTDLTAVLEYEDTLDSKDFPAATLWRGPITRRDLNEPEDQLYTYTSRVEWYIRVFVLVLPEGRAEAQALLDEMVQQCVAAFDRDANILDPGGPGQVEECVVAEAGEAEVIPGDASRNRPDQLTTELTLRTYSNTV